MKQPLLVLFLFMSFNALSQKTVVDLGPDSSLVRTSASFELLDKQVELLENSQDYMFQTIDRQWNHFALISSFILGLLGLGLPLIGFVTLKSYFESTKSQLDDYRRDFETHKEMIASEVEKLEKSHAYLRKEALESIAESAQTLSYVYRRLPRVTEYDKSHHMRSALQYSIKSISLHAQLLFEAGSEEHRNSVMNMIAGCNHTMKVLIQIYNGSDYLLNDLRKSFVKYDFEFIHELRKFFKNEGAVDSLNEFESNLRKLRLYGWPYPIEYVDSSR